MTAKYLSNGTRRFDGVNLTQIAMPMGGIGAGNICLNGHGGIQDFSIRNQPALSAMPDGHHAVDAAFALLHIKGDKPTTRLVEGPMPIGKIYDQGMQGQGYRKGGYEGLPRFEQCTFTSEYPFGHVELAHPNVPIHVKLTGFSPLVPLDDRTSSMPCAILEYALTNNSDAPVDCELSYHLAHLAVAGENHADERNHVIDGFGVLMNTNLNAHHKNFGSAALGVIGHQPHIKAMWLRGQWFDWIEMLWREVSTGTFTENHGNADANIQGHNGASIMMSGKLQPGQTITYPIVIAWHFPNPQQVIAPQETLVQLGRSGDQNKNEQDATPPPWRPYYAGQWKDAKDVALHVRDQYQTMRDRTRAFRDAINATTAPVELIDAVSSNLAILKSPTILRQENGNLWAWEGCFPTEGCCFGSCTHVWNYTQALPHLFPKLERTLREQELKRSMNDEGRVSFRSSLPDGPTDFNMHPAADGQLGGIMKVYRDWRITGDNDWLSKMFASTKRSMDFCIRHWDPDQRGALFEPHHNTYDIEFWGPDGMCTSIYLGALCAMAMMCDAMDQPDDAAAYRKLAQRSADYMDEHLYNGEYYHQKVMWNELHDQSFTQAMLEVNDESTDIEIIQKTHGPNHQYANGCLSDGVIGAWMAQIYHIDTPLNAKRVRSSLRSIFKHNFKADLSDHACLQRAGYAMGHEAGLVLCTWPHDDRPAIPFAYCDEVWTGFEYQVASHMISMGMVEEGMTIVRASRSRFTGDARNPFNEYECGNYYARAMSSYALLHTWAGLHYDAITQTLHLNPKTNDRPFTTFISTAKAWGTITLTESELVINLREGELPVKTLVIGADKSSQPFGDTHTAQAKTSLHIKLEM